MKKIIELYHRFETLSSIVLVCVLLFILLYVMPRIYTHSQTKKRAIYALNHDDVSYKGDTVCFGDIKILPEYRHSVMNIFIRADKMNKFAHNHGMRGFEIMLGYVGTTDGLCTFKFTYSAYDYTSMTIVYHRNDNYMRSAYLLDMGGKFEHYFTKYEKYHKQAIKDAEKERIKEEKIMNKLNKI
jgi:hypothetical protein